MAVVITASAITLLLEHLRFRRNRRDARFGPLEVLPFPGGVARERHRLEAAGREARAELGRLARLA